MERDSVIRAVEKEKVIAIVRGINAQSCLDTAKALYDGGIRLLEVTFNQIGKSEDTVRSIEAVAREFAGRLLVGAGTVLTAKQAEMAAQAGARYIISPDVNTAVIKRTKELGLVSMPGAFTPTEIMSAHNAGADYVKLFPAGNLGVAYIKAIRAPISHVKLLAVGGVNEKNIVEFLSAGCLGAGVGGNLVNKDWIAAGQFSRITRTAQDLVAAVRQPGGQV